MSASKLFKDEPLARSFVEAIHAGQIETVKELVQTHSGLASARLVDAKGESGTPLHAATDWPGFFTNGPDIVALLIDAGADPNAAIEGSCHADLLIDAGADPNAAIEGSCHAETPLRPEWSYPQPLLDENLTNEIRQQIGQRVWSLCRGFDGRYWARTSDPQLVETAPSFMRSRAGYFVFASLQGLHRSPWSTVGDCLHPLLGPGGSTW